MSCLSINDSDKYTNVRLVRNGKRKFQELSRKTRGGGNALHRMISLIPIVGLFISSFAFTLVFIDIVDASIKFTSDNNAQQQQVKQLDCQPGEQRHFNYESATKIWGASNQLVRIRGTLRLRCLEPATNSTLKYLAEVLSLSPGFGDNDKKKKDTQDKRARGLDGNNKLLRRVDSSSSPIQLGIKKADLESARAEPVFEEVGEAISETATRVKRSVSGWFNKTWGSVKDFFVNIFTSSEKSTVSREQAFRESGIDISSRCNSKSKTPVGLPIDDSVFDDFEPKYYIGASTDSLSGTAYDFDDRNGQFNGFTDDDEEYMAISFFDDPKPKISTTRASNRARRAISSKPSKSQSSSKSSQVENYDKLLKLPFVFIQSKVGKIMEIRFSNEETDISIKNFKRHLCDLFATNLDKSKSQMNEVSPIGQHTTKYLVDSSTNSNAIKNSLLKVGSHNQNNNLDEQANNKQLVKVLAMVAAATSESASDWTTKQSELNNSSSVGVSEGREPASSSTNSAISNQGDSLSVLRSINSTTTIQLNSRTVTPDIEQMEVRVKQVQHISDGRMTGTAGQLGMSLIQSSANWQPNKRIRFERSLSGSSPDYYKDKMTSSMSDKDKKNWNEEKDNNLNEEDSQFGDIADLLRISTSFSVQLVPYSKLGNFEALEMTLKDNDQVNDLSSSSGKEPEVRVKRNSRNESADSDDGDDGDDNIKLNKNSKKCDKEKEKEKSSQTMVDNNKESFNASGRDERRHMVGDKDNSNSSTVMTQPQPLATPIKANIATITTKRIKREPLVTRPGDLQELQSTMKEWHRLELSLKLAPTNLLPESSAQDGQIDRLEILRNQVQMRLNEEFMRNRLRRATKRQMIRVASLRQDGHESKQPKLTSQDGAKTAAFKDNNDLGLGLTQLILDNGITSKTKGSIYSTLEEVLDLEASLDEDSQDTSMSKLLRDTVRMDKLKAHCKSAILSLDDIRSQTSRLELRMPFNVKDNVEESLQGNERLSKVVADLSKANHKRLDQCKQVAQLLLRVNDRKVADLVIDMTDECNNRLLAGSRDEELGYGPISRYYRNLRQQFIELLTHLNRPSDSLIDKLLSRVHLLKDASVSKRKAVESQQEFTYVSVRATSDELNGQKYNKSLLREEDDFNNNDGVGSLIMTITSLGAKSSISRLKRIEIVEKLLNILKNSTCSLFNGPDLDILESMSNFQEPMDELVGKIVHLARRCKNLDQYLVACIHGLQGQLQHNSAQRFLIEQLRSINVSCTVKSEIVLVLIGAVLLEDLKSLKKSLSITNNNDLPVDNGKKWPIVGMNQVDDVLMELIDENQNSKRHLQDKKCLKQLVVHYMSKKEQINTNDIDKNHPQNNKSVGVGVQNRRRATGGSRHKRAVINDNSFWDDAQCKRWALPDPSTSSSPDNNTLYNFPFNSLSGNEEIDDNSILIALANNKPASNGKSRGNVARNLQLLERESESSTGSINKINNSSDNSNNNLQTIRKRHKCSASKTYGPKNAQATLKAEVVNDLIGAQDENKFLARFRLSTNFLGNSIDVGRMYLWHQKRTTRAHVNILGKSLWDTSHSCQDKAPNHLVYMPLFDFNLWLVKVSVGLRLRSEMGFFSNCDQHRQSTGAQSSRVETTTVKMAPELNEADVLANDQLELFPTVTLRASGEASAKFVVARAGMSVASQYGYQGSIRVSQQPDSCMSIYSAHQPMNITFSSWFQLWDNDCHYWGSRNKAEPQATKWKLSARKPTAWLEDECLQRSSTKSD